MKAFIFLPALLVTLALSALIGATPAQAQTVNFPGGDLDDLRAVSLSPVGLLFDHLNITGALTLSPDDGDVLIFARNLEIAVTGSIAYTQTACSYEPPPNLQIETTESVIVNGSIKLVGKFGKETLSGSQCRTDLLFRLPRGLPGRDQLVLWRHTE